MLLLHSLTSVTAVGQHVLLLALSAIKYLYLLIPAWQVSQSFHFPLMFCTLIIFDKMVVIGQVGRQELREKL